MAKNEKENRFKRAYGVDTAKSFVGYVAISRLVKDLLKDKFEIELNEIAGIIGPLMCDELGAGITGAAILHTIIFDIAKGTVKASFVDGKIMITYLGE
jgi:hypothetical protein